MPTRQSHFPNLLLATTVLLLGEFLLAVLVRTWPWLQAMDSRVSSALALTLHSPGYEIAELITRLGSGTIVVPLLLVSIAVLWARGNKQFAVAGVTGFLVARVITDGLKRLVERPRPSIEELGYIPDGYDLLSFPSGHTTSSCYLYGFLLLVYFTCMRSASLRLMATVLTLILVLSVGLSRVMLGEHFPSDVAGGLMSGGIGILVARIISHLDIRSPG